MLLLLPPQPRPSRKARATASEAFIDFTGIFQHELKSAILTCSSEPMNRGSLCLDVATLEVEATRSRVRARDSSHGALRRQRTCNNSKKRSMTRIVEAFLADRNTQLISAASPGGAC